jgi:hypothetical protein
MVRADDAPAGARFILRGAIAMRQGTYLNVILTVNAALLSVLAWTQLAGRPLLADDAAAQAGASAGDKGSMINAAEQRQRMIEALTDLKKAVEATRTTVESGRLRVEVTNLDQIRVAKER